jgi:ABC-type transporter Mla maintaining outer membrane lipid asymmetry ATPase subunit MlaF
MTSGSGISVAIHGLEKSFGAKHVLQGIHLHVHPSEFIAIAERARLPDPVVIHASGA